MNEEKFWLLLSLKLSGEACQEELQALDDMLREHPQLGFKAEIFEEAWKKNRNAVNTDAAFTKHLQLLQEKSVRMEADKEYPAVAAVPPVRKLYYRYAAFIAAAMALIALIVYWPGKENHSIKKQLAQNKVSTKKGSKSNVQLPDGTMVWLNADSKITYDENFRGSIREVFLEGEAFFDVVKDKARPFIIHTKKIDIRVLGTAFNVRSYSNENGTETSLFRGAVEVVLQANPGKKILLKPNEKLLVSDSEMQSGARVHPPHVRTAPDSETVIKLSNVHFQKSDSSALETLWVKNKLAFDAETLEVVAKKLERWYNVQVSIRNGKLMNVEYSAIFENESLEQVMEALKMTGEFEYAIHRNEVTIW